MYQCVEPYEAPLAINKRCAQGLFGSELFPEQQKFLCGLLKAKRPKKILELGVAGGGTSCLIQYTLQLLGQEAELYSVDLGRTFYRDDRKPVGFLSKEMEGAFPFVKHRLFTGGAFPEFASEIGGGIDFLMIDTAHCLPGELLEFLVCLPYLTKDATVVLHDVMLNQNGGNPDNYATKVLYTTVTADKYICWSKEEPERAYGLSNIGAFTLNEGTREHIEDCFYALTFNWLYEMPDEMEQKYHAILAAHYPQPCLALYDAAKRVNHMRMLHDRLMAGYHGRKALEQVLRKWRTTDRRVLFYGCGRQAQTFYEYGKLRGFRVDGFVVSDVEYIHAIPDCDLPMWQLRELPWPKEECMFLLTPADPEVRRTMEQNLRYEGYEKFI